MQRQVKESGSFLKKRTKKLLQPGLALAGMTRRFLRPGGISNF
jgi:hypothetical protein